MSSAICFNSDQSKILLSGNGFRKQVLVFTCLQYKSCENTVGKGEIARDEQFLLFLQCFLPFGRTFYHFHHFEIVVCKLFRFGVQVLSSGNGLNYKKKCSILFDRKRVNKMFKSDHNHNGVIQEKSDNAAEQSFIITDQNTCTVHKDSSLLVYCYFFNLCFSKFHLYFIKQ